MHQPSRRTFLAAASVGVAGLAGCLGGGGGDEGRDCSGDQRSVEVPATGDPGSEVTVAAYEDFECPGCREYVLNVYPQIEREYVEPGAVGYEHRDLPIPVDEEWSWKVPNAALAVLEDAGGEAYYAFVQDIYQHQGDYGEDVVAEVASGHGVEEGVVREALSEEPFCEQVNESRAEALDRGVESTPTVFVNDQQLEAPSASELSEAVESELG